MSELFGDNDAHLSKKNIMKEDFGWEIPVESVPLPSKGIIYSPDTTLYNRETVPIRAMTAHDEDILSSQAFIKEGTSIDNLIKSCVTDKTFNTENLIIGDRNALMISIRITGYGPEYKVAHSCMNCGTRNSLTANLGDLKINRLELDPVKKGENAFIFELPVTKKKVVFKFLTMKDDRNRSTENRNRKQAINSKIDANVTSFLNYSILSIDGITDRNKIHHFIKYMPAMDSKELRKYIRENEPGMDMSSSYKCESCDYSNDYKIPVTTEFFWPST